VTVQDAIHEVRKVGTIRAENGKLKLRFPEPAQAHLEAAIETLRHNREAALRTLTTPETDPAAIPPAANWPRALSELAAEVGQRSGDPEAARREVWVDWYEWKAAALNRLFQEQGTSGQPGKITAATVRHGERMRSDRPAELETNRNTKNENRRNTP
jgi:hypothetical protein